VVTVDIDAADVGAAHIVTDVTESDAAQRVVEEAVRRFGGLDLLVSNVGVFPSSQRIDALSDERWQRALAVNLTSHQRLLTAAIPYLQHGVDASVVIVGSKNVPAPGPEQA